MGVLIMFSTPLILTSDDIVKDIESGENIYEGKTIKISGEYIFDVPSTACYGFCLSHEEISELNEGDFTYINTYAPYGNNLCGGNINELKSNGHSIPIKNFPALEGNRGEYLGCNFSSGDSPIELTGTVTYTTVKNYCSLIEQPSIRLNLDKESVEQLKGIVPCM